MSSASLLFTPSTTSVILFSFWASTKNVKPSSLIGYALLLCRFLNSEDPLINHGPWTAVEDKNLLHIIQENGLSNWIDIAASLGTNRTPFQCLARYQRSLNASILKREWTSEEDNQLRAAVETYGESNWQVVASAIEGRTGTQCSNRSVNMLNNKS